MQDSLDLTTLIFLGLAVFVIWKLRSVLGQKTGSERPPFNLHSYFMTNPSLSGRGAAIDTSGSVPKLTLRGGTN